MRSELSELHGRLGATFVYVTHDQVEAMTMSDRIAMMDAGRILQLGTPSELYDRPANVKVAAFIGSPAINLLPARVAERGVVELFGRPVPITTALPSGARITIGLRPEAITLGPAGATPKPRVTVQATLLRKENLGPEYILHLEASEPLKTPIMSRVAAGPDLPALHRPATLTFNSQACHLFDESGERIEARATASCDQPAPSVVANAKVSA